MINFWLTGVPSWWQTFWKFFLSLFHFFLPVPLTLASLNGAGWIFPVNFNYQRCLENSDMIIFWLKSWVILWWLFSSSFLVCHFLPRTRVCNKQLLINTRPKYYYDNPVTFLGTRGKNRLTSDPWSEQAVPPFLLMENSLRFHSEILASLNFNKNKMLSPGLENNTTLKSCRVITQSQIPLGTDSNKLGQSPR